MSLDDLCIYSDWLEENDINNSLYKTFLNQLRIELIVSNEYGIGLTKGWDGDGHGYPNGFGDGYGFGYHVYGCYDGDGMSILFCHESLSNFSGNGKSI